MTANINPQKPWYAVSPELFDAHVLVYVGPRDAMLRTVPEALKCAVPDAEAAAAVVAELTARMTEQSGQKDQDEYVYVKSPDAPAVHFIRLEAFDPTRCTAVTSLSHQCLHVAVNILQGWKVAESGDHECLCHVHEGIFRQLLQEMTGCAGSTRAWTARDNVLLRTAIWHVSNSVSNGKSTDVDCETTDWLRRMQSRVSGVASGQAEDAFGSGLGMRNALRSILELTRDIDLTQDTVGNEVYRTAAAALCEPARNCDNFGADVLWDAYLVDATSDWDKHDNVDFRRWLSRRGGRSAV